MEEGRNEGYTQIQQFLESRNIDYLLPAFVVNEIDDSIATSCSDAKLLEMGLVYGDILSFRKKFNQDNKNDNNSLFNGNQKAKSYEERAEELRKRIKKTHTNRLDSSNRAVFVKPTYQVSFGLKCLEKKKYTLKLNQSFSEEIQRDASYDDIHTLCRKNFDIPPSTETYLAHYNGVKIDGSFTTVENFAYQQRDKKKSLHLYLYYPNSYDRMKFKTLLYEAVSDHGDDIDKINAEVSIAEVPTNNFEEESASFQPTNVPNTNSSPSSPYVDLTNECEIQGEEFPIFQLARNCDRPLRYRHSIGSPSLSLGSATVESDVTTTNVEATLYGDDEVDRFFEVNDVDLSQKPVAVPKHVANEDVISFLQDVTFRFQMARQTDDLKHVIVQRDGNRFWGILFRQKFDFRNQDILIRFAGESGADAGGLLREFLTLAMRNFHHIPGITMGSNSIWLKMVPEYLVNNRYFMLGQLTGMAIITIGKGPECFNLMLVQALFSVPHDEILPEFDDGELAAMMSQIKSGNTDPLLENDIMTNDVKAGTRLLAISHIILRNSGAIEQFAKGLQSIDEALIASENFATMKQFLMESKTVLTLEEFLKILEFKKACDDNSNTGRAIGNAICDVELFIASVANNEIEGAKLSDLLYLFTGLEKVPPFGLHKKIEISFSEEEKFAKISTCAYTVVLPFKDIEKVLKISLEYGGGFGCV